MTNMRLRQAKTKSEEKEKKSETALNNLSNVRGMSNSSGKAQIPTLKEVAAEQMGSAVKPTTKVSPAINSEIGISRKHGVSTPATSRKHVMDTRSTQQMGETLATNKAAQVITGFGSGVLPVDVGFGKYGKETEEKIKNSGAYKAGDVAGMMAQYAVGYGAGKGAIKAATKGGKLLKNAGKIANVAAEDALLDATVGTALNANQVYVKEGKRGAEAAKEMGINAAMDFGIGGFIDLGAPAIKKFAKDLSERLGRTVTEKEAKKMLEANAKDQPAFTREELARKLMAHDANISEEEADKLLRQLAEDSNRRKGKVTPEGDTLYGNSHTLAAAELPAPDPNAHNRTYIRQMEGEAPAPRQRERKPDTWADAANYIDELKVMPPVANIDSPQFHMGDRLVDKVSTFFASLGGKVHRDGLGEVIINRRGVKDSIGHGMTEEKAKAFEAVPDIIRKGKIISEKENWGGRGYDNILIVAPVKIAGDTKHIGAIVKRDANSKRYYLHEVLDLDEIKTGGEFSPGPFSKGLPGSAPAVKDSLNSSSKNVNTSGQKIPTLEEVAAKQMGKAPRQDAIPPLEEVVAKQMGGKPKKVKKQKDLNAAEKAYTAMVDNLYPVAKTDDAVKVFTSNMRKSKGTASHIIENGMVDMAGKDISIKRPDGTNVTLKKVFDDAAEIDLDAFNDYLLHRNNIDRAANKKNIFTDYSSEASRKKCEEYLAQYPQFKQLGEEISQMNAQLIDKWMVESGLISKDLGEKLKSMYKNYVPSYREDVVRKEGFKGRTVKANKVVSEATGGNKPVIAPNISIAAQLNKTIRAARMNEVANKLYDAVRANPEALENVAKIADKTNSAVYKDTLIKNSENAIAHQGLDGVDNVTKDLIGQDDVTKDFFVVAMRNGKPQRMTVSKDIYDALQTLNKVNDEEVASKIFNAISDVLTKPFKSVVTGYNPFFGIRNLIRDIPTAYIQGTTHNPITFTANMAQAYKDIATNAPNWQRYKALGGKQGGYVNTEGGLAAGKGLVGNMRSGAGKALDAIAWANETTEAATRYAEFLGTLKKAGNVKDPAYDDIMRALYNAGEVTVNFGRSGDVTKAADKVVPYLNPAVQGIDKFLRSMAKPSSWAKGMAALTVPSIGLYEYNQKYHKDDYDKLDDRTKDAYYCFYIPGSDGKFVKIPKSREAGVLFCTLAERIMRKIAGDEDAFKGFGNAVATNFAPQNPFENNIFAPATINLPRNKDFADRTIVPRRLEGYKKSEQYDERTSDVAKWLGEAAAKLGINDGEGLSPKQIDYIIDSYTGIIGDILIPATTQGGDVIQKVVTGPFTVDNVYSNRIQNDFYDEMTKAEKEKNSINLNDGIESNWKTPEEYRYSLYTKASKEMGELRKLERKYQTLPNSETKTLYLRELRKQINDIAEQTSKNIDQAVRDYSASYIPEISDMSDDRQKYYRENLKRLSVNPGDLRNAYNAMDKNGSGSISQDEAYAVLEQSGFSREQKAAIWNFINSSWKKNPYL